MDNSFTENVLERARQRQKKLGPLREANAVSTSSPNISHSEILRARKEVVSDSILMTPPKIMTRNNSKTKISSNISSSPSQEFNTLNIQKDSLNMEIRFSSAENVRVEVEIQSDDESGVPQAIVHEIKESTTSTPAKIIDTASDSCDEGNDHENVENVPVLRKESKTRLQRFGKLYSDTEDLSSPISRTEGKFQIDDPPKDDKENLQTEDSKPKKRFGKLAELAKDINEWEDDITSSRKNLQERKATTPTKKWKPPAPQPPKQVSPKKTHGKQPAPKPPVVTSFSPKKQVSSETTDKNIATSTAKQLKWDKSVLDTLESQGFTRTESNSRLVYKFKNSQDKEVKTDAISEQVEEQPEQEPADEKKKDKEVLVEKPAIKPKTAKKFEKLPLCKEDNLVTPRSPVKSSKIASRAAMFENAAPSSPVKKDTDPALLTVSQRKALFEKNAGEALVPKAAFGMAAPISKVQPSPSTHSELNKKVESPVIVTKVKESGNIAEKIALLNQDAASATISQRQIEGQVKADRQKEMDVLLNRFNKNKEIKSLDAIETDESDQSEDEDEISETTAMISSSSKPIVKVVRKSSDMPPPPPPPTDSRKSGEKRPKSGDSIQVQAVLGDIKRIKVTRPKDGKLYPCLSDIEATTETDPDASASPTNSSLDESYESENGANTSLGREVLQAMYSRNHQTDQKRVSVCSTDSNISDVLTDMNEFLNDIDSEDSIGPTPSKQGKLHSPQKSHVSQSFSYKKFSPTKSPSKFRSPCKIITSARRDSGSNLPTHVVDGSDVLPLTYTVSFYRKQQNQGSTPVRQVKHHEDEEVDEILELSDESIQVADKIEELMREVNKQQLVISQASSALNLCISTPEFTGSTEQVEAERLLLLASHRRQALTNEIQRLKVEKTLRPSAQHSQNLPIERGTLIISNISLPLKKEYTKALAAAGGKGHHVVCLVKCGEQIADTQLVSTVAGSSKNLDVELVIPGQVKLTNVYSDFTVTLEVYCLQAQEEILPHEVKYHIGKKGKLTPKRPKGENRMLRPPKESPAGPQAVRSSSFALNGYIVFSIQAISKTQWTLNQTPPISPLDGSVNMRVHCELNVSVEHRGFLNMFEDVSGLGAWHRRWCLLKGNLISYWKYPEDERKKAPIDTIDLRSCITKTVGSVSREICARLHTFLLERERPIQSGDKDTLTVSCHGHKTIIKHLLSADTKEERIEWCANLNKSLNALRMCGGGVKSTEF